MQEEYDFEVEWKAYEIMPEGRPRPTMEQLKQGFESFRRTAEKEGLKVNFNPNFSSSRLALEGAKYAQLKGKFEEFNKLVYEAQFLHSRDISNMETLVSIAEKAGMDSNDFKTALEERHMKEYVDADIEEAQKRQVMAAPTFFIGDTKIVGSKTEKAFRDALDKELTPHEPGAHNEG